VSLPGLDCWVCGPAKALVGGYFFSASGSWSWMAAPFVARELFAIRTCCLIAVRSSRASFLSSASASGLKGTPQSARIWAVISSIRASVEEGTAGVYETFCLRSIQDTPELERRNAAEVSVVERPLYACVLQASIRAISSYSPLSGALRVRC
jgi:hypothetical protein